MTDRRRLTELYQKRTALLTALADTLQDAFEAQLGDIPHIDRVEFRVKTTESFVAKVLDRKTDPPYTEPLLEVEDQVAGRVLVFFLDDVDIVQQAVQRLVTPVESYRSQPDRYNQFDYESFHGVYGIPPPYQPAGWEGLEDAPATFELQIRTLFQHAYAEPQHDVTYKPTAALTHDDTRELAWVAASAWGSDRALLRVRKRIDACGAPPAEQFG
jgi:putative GTP pyrophosphokinase